MTENENEKLESLELNDVLGGDLASKESIKFSDDSKVQKAIGKFKKRSEEDSAAQRAKELGLEYIDLNIYPIDQENITFISKEDARKYNVIAIRKQDRKVKIAATQPDNKETEAFLERVKEETGVELEIFLVSSSSFERAWDEYNKTKLADVFDYMKMGLTGDDLEEFEKNLQGVADLEKRINELPVTEVLNLVIAGSMKLGSSDIHFEPQRGNNTRLRYRIDGVLQTIADFPVQTYKSIISRIKVLGKMKLNVHEVAQDGRFSIKLGEEREMGVRISVIPGSYGESIVIRLLNSSIDDLKLDKVGLTGMNYEWLCGQAEKTQGMIINSGPTGSGKTTTLYAIINKLNTPDKKILSIEDPVEYQVPGVSQTQVNVDMGYTFHEGMRAAMRQDPDVMLVGEIRDDITAETAIHAALTGHLVLTTIHANSAAGVVGRIVDLGIKPALIGPATNCFIAQRLLRRLCNNCKESYQPAQETVDRIKKILALISPKAKVDIPKKIDKLWRPKGCPKCRGLGYKGRVGIFEILIINEDIKKLVERLATEDEIRRVALENGMITLEQDGMLKSIEGVTSIEELQRVVGKGDYLMEMYEKLMVQSLSQGIVVDVEIVERIAKVKDDPEKLRREMEQVSPTDMIKYILSSAMLMNTGDVHIEPGADEFKVRFRIDGVLHDVVVLPMTEYLNLLNKIKNLAGFKTESRQGVIDGRFKVEFDNEITYLKSNSVDIRLSIILGGFGDIVVMRLLTGASSASKLEDLNFHPVNLEKLKRNIFKPNGIILNTGPTGSGKTTTLYSVLALLNKSETKIITVEDPIEYQMQGLIQTQVNEEENYTFATAMRALLRQNPDIMMIGEIRDDETAETAYQAALTGHLVLSTLHTNSAAGAVQRLINMGLNLSDLAAGTNCFIAQRLARILCPHCKKEVQPSPEVAEKIQEVLNGISPAVGLERKPILGSLYESVGCTECHNLGYKGRVPVVEILEITEDLEKVIVTGPTTSELQNKAIESGMLTLAQDGILKVLDGLTSFEEIARISREIN